MFSSKDLFFTPAAGGYTVSKSLRFRSSASAYLNRTFGTPTNNKIWTWSGWVKIGKIATDMKLFSTSVANTPFSSFYIDGNANLSYYEYTGSNYVLTSSQVFRDPSAWYHIVIAMDTTQATSSNITRFYVNGVKIASSGSYVPQNTNTALNSAIVAYIGQAGNSSGYLDGYLAEVNFIDGYPTVGGTTYNATTWAALNVATLFGAYDTNGIWQPAAYTGSYGNNGFYLKFTDVGATSGSNSGYGKDFAGTNYWTTNNFGTTSTAVTYDSMLDSPTNATGDIGNYCTFNPLVNSSLTTISGGNLNNTASTGYDAVCTQAPNYKCYFEMTVIASSGTTPAIFMGDVVVYNPWVNNALSVNGAFGIRPSGLVIVNGVNGSTYSSYTTGNVVGFAFDPSNGKFWYSVNGVWANSGDPDAGTGNVGTATVGLNYVPGAYTATSNGVNANFGQRPFSYPPSSANKNSTFSAINTQNLSTPTITNGAQYMVAVTYQGATAPNTVTATSTNSGNNPNAVTFQPDLVWIKARSAATNHKLTDVARGTTKALSSNLASAETTDTNGLTAFTASGFTVGSDTNYNNTTGPVTYVAWEWKAASGTSTVPSGGTITPTAASLNTAAGFSIIAYTGNGTSGATVPHGLGVTPNMVIVKGRDNTNSWMVKHSSTTTNTNLFLSDTSANYTTPPSGYISDLSSSSTVTLTAGSAGIQNVNTNAEKYIMYSWAAIANYSAFGSYTGNGSADGPFVYTGFRPRFVMIKGTGTATSWLMVDSARNDSNVVNNHLGANLAEIENGASLGNNTNQLIDFLSNGFKIRMTNSDMNNSGANYIYMAVAENPFKISRAR